MVLYNDNNVKEKLKTSCSVLLHTSVIYLFIYVFRWVYYWEWPLCAESDQPACPKQLIDLPAQNSWSAWPAPISWPTTPTCWLVGNCHARPLTHILRLFLRWDWGNLPYNPVKTLWHFPFTHILLPTVKKIYHTPILNYLRPFDISRRSVPLLSTKTQTELLGKITTFFLWPISATPIGFPSQPPLPSWLTVVIWHYRKAGGEFLYTRLPLQWTE